MKNKLISFILALCLLIAIPLEARYKYNPFTRKLDYYETGADIDLGDLADVTLTALAGGAILYYNGTAWVNLPRGANGEFLSLAAGVPDWAVVPAGATTFLALTDTPANYTGDALKLVSVNAGETALEFFAGSAAGTVIVANGAGGWAKDANFLITSGSASATGSLTANSGGAAGEIGLNLYGAGAGPQFSSIVQSDAEGAGSELRIGLDETTRTIQIMDRGDIGTNFGWGGVSPHPTLYFVNADGDKASLITNYDGNFLFSNYGATDFITMQAGLYFDFVKETDSAGDDSYAFFFGTWGADGELIDTDAEQSWMKIAPQINQTDTAHYVGLLMDVTEASTGSGANELMALRVASADKFTIDTAGKVTTGVWEATAIASGYLGAHASAHEVGGGDLVDHDSLTNYVANEHVDHTAVTFSAAGLITGGGTLAANRTFTLTEATIEAAIDTLGAILFTGDATFNEDVFMTWADSADHAVILQEAATGVENQALVLIDDQREGATVDEAHEASLVINADGPTYAFYIQDGDARFGTIAYFAGDTYQYEDVFVTWAEAADHAVIAQAAVTGIEDQPLIFIDDDRTGDTANELSESTIIIDAEGVYGFYVKDGKTCLDDVLYLSYLTTARIPFVGTNGEIKENDNFYWDDGNERLGIGTGPPANPLAVYGAGTTVGGVAPYTDVVAFFRNTIESKHTAISINALDGYDAVLYLGDGIVPVWDIRNDASEPNEFQIRYQVGGANVTYFQMNNSGDVEILEGDFSVTMDAALDHIVITQSAVAGIEGQPLIFIDDARTGATANSTAEATIVIDAEGTYALYILDGFSSFGTKAFFTGAAEFSSTALVTSNNWLIVGAGNQSAWLHDTNAANDGILRWDLRSVAADSSVVFMTSTDQAVDAMADHDGYINPTFVLASMGGADPFDYAGVVIGERAQADVKVAHYFDFYAMTGAVDGSVDTADELAAIFRFGASGSATPGYATTPGDVLFEGTIEIDGDVHVAGYHRTDMIFWVDSFARGAEVSKYAWAWDITSLRTQGTGTNTIDTNPSNITLTTDNANPGDNEGTRSELKIIERARQNRSGIGVDLAQTANTQFYFGWNDSGTNAMVSDADKYVIVFFDKSDDDHWQIKVGDGTTEDVFTSAVAADTNHIGHEIWVETDGTVHWLVNGTELDITGTVDNKMHADPHYLIVGQAQSVTGAAAIVVNIDYIENEKTKGH